MTREEKVNVVADLTEEFKASNAIIICDYKGMAVFELEAVRNLALEAGAKVRVTKNTLTKIALANAEQEEVELVNTNLIIWSNEQISACKVADKAASTFDEKFVIKTGLLEGKVADLATIEAMAKLPGRDELLGMLLSVWSAPARNMVTGLDNLREKLEEDSAA